MDLEIEMLDGLIRREIEKEGGVSSVGASVKRLSGQRQLIFDAVDRSSLPEIVIVDSESGLPELNKADSHQASPGWYKELLDAGVFVAACHRGGEQGGDEVFTAENHSVAAETMERDRSPAWNVEAFRWPAVSGTILDLQSERLSSLVDVMWSEDRGHRSVMFTSLASGQGRSTLAISLARYLAGQGRQTLLVDADVYHGGLAEKASLEFQLGWQDLMNGKLPVEEFMVASEASRLVLLCCAPGSKIGGEHLNCGSRICDILDEVSREFDSVVVDGGTVSELGTLFHDCQLSVDYTVVVGDGSEEGSVLQDAQHKLALLGLSQQIYAKNYSPGRSRVA